MPKATSTPSFFNSSTTISAPFNFAPAIALFRV
jgi:hypothetical protein